MKSKFVIFSTKNHNQKRQRKWLLSLENHQRPHFFFMKAVLKINIIKRIEVKDRN